MAHESPDVDVDDQEWSNVQVSLCEIGAGGDLPSLASGSLTLQLTTDLSAVHQ